MFAVLIQKGDDKQDICGISGQWLSVQQSQMLILNLSQGRFHHLVGIQDTVPGGTAKRPAFLLTHTGKPISKIHCIEQPCTMRWRILNQLEDNQSPSDDATIETGLLSKRSRLGSSQSKYSQLL